ncbi:MAG: hypothetical protein AB7I59_08750 [Geminicoccaceae bacterium]
MIDGPIGCEHPPRAAAARMGITRPTVSARANHRLEGFPVERPMLVLTALDRGVETVIRGKPRSRAAGRITVNAA